MKIQILAIVIIVVSALLLLVVIALLSLSTTDRSVIFGKLHNFEFAGLSRTYLVHAPKNEVKKIVVGLHGFRGSARQFAYYTGLHNATDSNTLVIYPNATKSMNPMQASGWNSGFCCGTGFLNNIDDAGYIDALIKKVKADYNAQDAKVYATGFSNGAFMTQRLATDYPDVFEAVASISGSIGTSNKSLQPTNPVPILITHGQQDKTVAFAGGPGKDPDFEWLSHQQTVDAWQDVNGANAKVESVVYPNDAHKWHDWRLLNFWHHNPQQSQQIVEFFNSY